MATTTVQFIGLCVFTTQALLSNATNNATRARTIGDISLPSTPSKVVVILPKAAPSPPGDPVTNDHNVSQMRMAAPGAANARSAPATEPGGRLPLIASIPEHKGILRWKKANDFVSATGWNVSPTSLSLELNGEHLTIVSDIPNQPLVPSTGLPRLKPLQASLVSQAALSANYVNAPYTASAAVIDIPNGTLTSCAHVCGEINTTLALNSLNSITITGEGGKKIVFRAGAQITIINEPTTQQQGHPVSHYAAYCPVIGMSDCTFNLEPDTLTCGGDHWPCPAQIGDFVCSNTQWP
jgi:hypothetical protein